MARFASCVSCQGFVADPTAICIHCGVAPRPRRALARFLALRLFGASAMVTMMACYGAVSDYDCYQVAEGVCVECIGNDDCDSNEYCAADGDCHWSCDDHGDCDDEQRCDFDTGECVPTSPCYALDGCGEGALCDIEWQVCIPCPDGECGACTGEVTCSEPPPYCGGGRPSIVDGCYTGACIDEAICALEVCASLAESGCLSRADCEPLYVGLDCTNPSGEDCSSGGGCVCDSFAFDACASAPATAIAAGDCHTCAVVRGGVQCWGENYAGQLGNGSWESSAVPVSVAGLAGEIQAIAAGTLHTCALVDGSVWCWGTNGNG